MVLHDHASRIISLERGHKVAQPMMEHYIAPDVQEVTSLP